MILIKRLSLQKTFIDKEVVSDKWYVLSQKTHCTYLQIAQFILTQSHEPKETCQLSIIN